MSTNIDYLYGLPVDIGSTPPPKSDPASPPFREHLASTSEDAPRRIDTAADDDDAARGIQPSTLRKDAPASEKPSSNADSARGDEKDHAKQSASEDADPSSSGDDESAVDQGSIRSIEEESLHADGSKLDNNREALPTVPTGSAQTIDADGGHSTAETNSSGNTNGEGNVHLAPRPPRDGGDPEPTPLPEPVPGRPDPKDKDGKPGKPVGEGEVTIDARMRHQPEEKGDQAPRPTKGPKDDHQPKAEDSRGKFRPDKENRGAGAAEAATIHKEKRRTQGNKVYEIEPRELLARGAREEVRANMHSLMTREISESAASSASENARSTSTDAPSDGKSATTNSAPEGGDAATTATTKADGVGNRLSTLLGHKGTGELRQPPLSDAQQARLVQRVSRAFDAARARGESAVRLRLAPPELGSLRLEVQVESGSLVARLEVETPAAREALLDNLNTLRQRLAEQNIRIDQFDVDLLDRQSEDRWQRGDEQQHQDAPRDERQPAGVEERERVSPTLQTPTLEQPLDEGVIDVII